jgi:hypothetical protein
MINTIFQVVTYPTFNKIFFNKDKIEPQTTFLLSEFKEKIIERFVDNKDILIEWNLEYLLSIGLIKSDDIFYVINSDYLKFEDGAIKTLYFNTKPHDHFDTNNHIDTYSERINYILEFNNQKKIEIKRMLF